MTRAFNDWRILWGGRGRLGYRIYAKTIGPALCPFRGCVPRLRPKPKEAEAEEEGEEEEEAEEEEEEEGEEAEEAEEAEEEEEAEEAKRNNTRKPLLAEVNERA